jgi:hypothetical protein
VERAGNAGNAGKGGLPRSWEFPASHWRPEVWNIGLLSGKYSTSGSGLQRPSRDMGIWKKHLGLKPGTVPLCYCRSLASLTSFEPLMSHHSHHSHHSCPLPVSHPPVEKEEAGRNVQSQGDASAGLDAWIRPKMLLILALALCCVCQESLHPIDNTGYCTLGTGHSALCARPARGGLDSWKVTTPSPMQMVADGGPLDLGWGGPACLCPAAPAARPG